MAENLGDGAGRKSSNGNGELSAEFVAALA